MHGIHNISLAVRYRVATRSSTLTDGLAKIQAARNRPVTLHVFFSVWDGPMLHRSMAHNTMEAHEYVCQLDRSRSVPVHTNSKLQQPKCSVSFEQQRDFSQPIASRASQGTRATRPGLAVCVVRVMSNGLCVARRFHGVLQSGSASGKIASFGCCKEVHNTRFSHTLLERRRQ